MKRCHLGRHMNFWPQFWHKHSRPGKNACLIHILAVCFKVWPCCPQPLISALVTWGWTASWIACGSDDWLCFFWWAGKVQFALVMMVCASIQDYAGQALVCQGNRGGLSWSQMLTGALLSSHNGPGGWVSWMMMMITTFLTVSACSA